MRELRKLQGLTQDEVGQAVGVKGSAVGQWETGRTSPLWNHVAKLDGILKAGGEVVRLYRGPDVADDLPSQLADLRAAHDLFRSETQAELGRIQATLELLTTAVEGEGGVGRQDSAADDG